MTHQQHTRPPTSSRTTLVRRVRRLGVALTGRLRLAVAAGITLVLAAVTAIVGGVFALAALVRGLEQVLPGWAAYAVTAVLLLSCAVLALVVGRWMLRRATGHH